MPSLSTAYWVLSALSAQMYLVMYLFMFIAAIRLRYSHPKVKRAYQIPMPHKGMWFVASIGILASLFAIFIGFIPPPNFEIKSLVSYEFLMGGGLLAMIAVPLLLYQCRKPNWVLKN